MITSVCCTVLFVFVGLSLLIQLVLGLNGVLEELQNLKKQQKQINNKINNLNRILDYDLCNNNGFYYDDINGCNCFSCFSGEDCSLYNSSDSCLIKDTKGNPQLFEYYWRNHTDLGFEQVPAYYRSPYQYPLSIAYGYIESNYDSSNPYQGTLYPVLADKIIELHKLIGNVKNTEKKNIVLGQGGTQLINALDYACQQLYGNINETMYIYARPPYYSGYTSGYIDLNAKNIQFPTSQNLDSSQVIEYVTYPNNPTNDMRLPVYSNSACTIYDNVYYWPSLFDNITALDSSIAIFSMSKLTGHAGTRLGWALVDDVNLANKMGEFIATVQKEVSIDSQYRAFNMINTLLDSNGQIANDFFNWVKNQMKNRWEQINTIFDPNTQTRFAQYSKTGGFYAWVQCLNTDEQNNCLQVFENVGLQPSAGTNFGGDNSYVRLELVVPPVIWDIMVTRLESLV